MAKKIWVVLDPKPASTLADFVWETTAREFALACIGGPETVNEHPEFWATKAEALEDAQDRCDKLSGHFETVSGTLRQAIVLEEERLYGQRPTP